jgi:hypothetical protein
MSRRNLRRIALPCAAFALVFHPCLALARDYHQEAVGFPADFDIAPRTEEVTWDYVKIGDASHLLPVGANFLIVYSNSSRFRIEVTYANHRHFESATHITFP